MKMLLSSLILLSGLSFATAACSPTEESVNTEEPTPTPKPEPTPEPQRDIIRRYVNEGRAILYEYIKNGNETKINGRNLYPIYTKE